jgi:hypothetical protein
MADIASKDEVLAVLTSILRGEYDARVPERIRAADYLGRAYGLWKEAELELRRKPPPETGADAWVRNLIELEEDKKARKSWAAEYAAQVDKELEEWLNGSEDRPKYSAWRTPLDTSRPSPEDGHTPGND